MSVAQSFIDQLSYGQRYQLIFSCLLSVLAAVAEVVPVFIIIELVHLMLASAPVNGTLGLLLAAFFIKMLLVSAAYGLSHKLAYSFIYALRCRILQQLQQAAIDQLHQHSSAELKQCLIQDVEQLETSIAHHLVEAIIAICFPLLLLLALFWLHPALVAAAVLPLIFALWQMQRLSRLFHHDQLSYSATIASLNAALQAFIRCLAMMRVYQQDSRRFRLFVTQQRAYQDLLEKIIVRAAPAWSVFSSSVTASAFLVTLLAFVLLQQGLLAETEFYLSVFIVMAMLRPMLKITRLSSELDLVVQCWQRLQPWLKPVIARDSSAQLMVDNQPAADVIGLQKISYRLADKVILTKLTLGIAAQQCTLIVGPSGAGKSILLHILAGLRQPDSGQVTLAKTNREPFALLVEQQAHIFNDSLRNNLTLGKDIADTAIIRVLHTVQLGYLADRFSAGLDAPLAYRGNNLSGGEKQRLAIARALLTDAPVLLLDEIVAFVDGVTQQRLLSELQASCRGRTLVFVSHCPLPGLDIDHVLVMDAGQLLCHGSHQHVLQHSEFYRRFHRQTEDLSRPVRYGDTDYA